MTFQQEGKYLQESIVSRIPVVTGKIECLSICLIAVKAVLIDQVHSECKFFMWLYIWFQSTAQF